MSLRVKRQDRIEPVNTSCGVDGVGNGGGDGVDRGRNGVSLNIHPPLQDSVVSTLLQAGKGWS